MSQPIADAQRALKPLGSGESVLSVLYIKDLSVHDPRLQGIVDNEDFLCLQHRLQASNRRMLLDRSQVYHLDGFTAFLIPVSTSIVHPAATFVAYRINRNYGGPRAVLFEVNGGIGPQLNLMPECIRSVTFSSASGANAFTLRYTSMLADGREVAELLQISNEDAEEDDGFWGSLGDFFEGLGDGIAEFFSDVWDWLKKLGKDIIEEIRRGTARIRELVIGDGETRIVVEKEVFTFG